MAGPGAGSGTLVADVLHLGTDPQAPHSPFQLEVAIWLTDRLSVLAVATPFGLDQVLVRFVEGNPDHDDALKGQRLPMVLEVAAIYAEKLGKKEIWLKPTTPQVLNYCLSKLGFTEALGGQCKMLVEVTS